MKKFKLYFFYIITFGIGYLIAKRKVINSKDEINTELVVSSKIPFQINELYEAIGGKENYNSSFATISSITINVNDVTLIKQSEIKKLGAKGTILKENGITCLFGDFSIELDKKLKSK